MGAPNCVRTPAYAAVCLSSSAAAPIMYIAASAPAKLQTSRCDLACHGTVDAVGDTARVVSHQSGAFQQSAARRVGLTATSGDVTSPPSVHSNKRSASTTNGTDTSLAVAAVNPTMIGRVPAEAPAMSSTSAPAAASAATPTHWCRTSGAVSATPACSATRAASNALPPLPP